MRLLECIGIEPQKPQNVLEVCAGNGYFAQLMGWKCTDIEPGNPWVQKMDALEAAKTIPCDVIFASWIEYESTLDVELAKLEKPMIVVGEWPGGCCGSNEFSDYKRLNCADRCYPWFKDVPNWEGIYDCTMLVNWPEEFLD